jgi:homoprotocatechuate degradation regulator HpaR
MDEPELPPDLPAILRRALDGIVAPFRPLLAEHGLTEQQWRVLRAVRGGAESQVELSAVCAIHPASLTGVLGRMERDGLIERRRSGEDQRRIVVTTAPAGEELLGRLAPLIAARYEQLADRLGRDTLAELERTARAAAGLGPAVRPARSSRASR